MREVQRLYLQERREEFSARATGKIAYPSDFSPKRRAKEMDLKKGKMAAFAQGAYGHHKVDQAMSKFWDDEHASLPSLPLLLSLSTYRRSDNE